MTEHAVLDLTFKTKEELAENVKVRDNLGFSDHESEIQDPERRE